MSLSLLLLLAAQPNERWIVLPFVTGDQVTASSIGSAVDRATKLRERIQLLPLDAYYQAEGGAARSRIRECSADVDCVIRELSAFEADVAMIVVLDLELEPPLLSLIAIHGPKRSTLFERDGTTTLASAEADVEARTASLLDELGYRRLGRIMVEVDPMDAELTLEGIAPDSGTTNVFTLAPGRYSLTARAEGLVEKTISVLAEAGAIERVHLSLEGEPLYRSPWLWAGVSAVVVAGIVTAVVLLVPDERCVGPVGLCP